MVFVYVYYEKLSGGFLILRSSSSLAKWVRFASLVFAPVCAFAQTSYITTVAGTEWIFPSFLPAGSPAPLGNIWGITTDKSGTVYVADPGNEMVFRVTVAGQVSVVAGNGLRTYSGDNGPAMNAALNNPIGVAFDPSGNLLIADSANYRLRSVTPDGTITTIAGNGQQGSCADSPSALIAALPIVNSIAVDVQGNGHEPPEMVKPLLSAAKLPAKRKSVSKSA